MSELSQEATVVQQTVIVEQQDDMLRVSSTKRALEVATILPVKRQKTTASTAFAHIPFSLSAFRHGLCKSGPSPTEAELLALECETLQLSWLKLLAPELRKDYFLKLKRVLWSEGVYGKDTPVKTSGVFPPACDIYSWSRLPLAKIKCVILGQDPYHNIGQAHGLSFSVRPNIPIPPSLKNIYKEIKNDYPDFKIPAHGYLDAWAKEGVLCLNTALTVRAHQANSHAKIGWDQFTDAILTAIDKYGGCGLSDGDGGVVFLAWGSNAIKRMAKIDKKKHLVLTSVHPSPLSASRGFFGNGHFKQTNNWLKERHGVEVDWTAVSSQP